MRLSSGRGIPRRRFRAAERRDTRQLAFDTDSPIPAPATVAALVVWLVLIPAGMLALSTARTMSKVHTEPEHEASSGSA